MTRHGHVVCALPTVLTCGEDVKTSCSRLTSWAPSHVRSTDNGTSNACSVGVPKGPGDAGGSVDRAKPCQAARATRKFLRRLGQCGALPEAARKAAIHFIARCTSSIDYENLGSSSLKLPSSWAQIEGLGCRVYLDPKSM